MEYTRLGLSGLKVSRVGLGCMSYGRAATGLHQWTLDEDAAAPFFRQAVELGVTFWDTANAYQSGTSEEFVGRAIEKYSRREDIVLATKVWGKMHDASTTCSGMSRKSSSARRTTTSGAIRRAFGVSSIARHGASSTSFESMRCRKSAASGPATRT